MEQKERVVKSIVGQTASLSPVGQTASLSPVGQIGNLSYGFLSPEMKQRIVYLANPPISPTALRRLLKTILLTPADVAMFCYDYAAVAYRQLTPNLTLADSLARLVQQAHRDQQIHRLLEVPLIGRWVVERAE